MYRREDVAGGPRCDYIHQKHLLGIEMNAPQMALLNLLAQTAK